tara:strand:+ start:1579 stop:1827 length:249 start_codon:yes stop_codon:yes gene_type:complete
MADKKISELTANTNPSKDDIAPVSNSAATSTSKVTLRNIAKNFSDNTGITGADKVSNIVSLTQSEYDALSSYDASTVYIIVG